MSLENNALGRIEKTFTGGETFLNACGYVPILSSVSGDFRSLIGVVQAVVFGIFAAAAAIVGQKALSQRYVCSLMNGVGNFCRGLVEAIPILGNISCFVYDSTGHSLKYIENRVDEDAIAIKVASNRELENSFRSSRAYMGV